jgi:hypothetical protein
MISYHSSLKIIFSLFLSLGITPCFAVELIDGTVSFEKAPRLVSLNSTFKGVRQWNSKYYLTIIIPEDVGPPLGKVSFTQISGSENIDFNLGETFAFLGTQENRGESISLTAKLTESESDYQTIMIDFNEGVKPGETLTIGFKPYRNPSYSGEYAFRVKTYPLGEKSLPLDLGVRGLYFWAPEFGD